MRASRLAVLFSREALWTGSLFLLFLFALLVQPLRSADFWWHLKVGEIVLDEHAVPRVDRFSTTMAGHPYTYQSWLAGVCFALLYRLGGAGTVVVAHALLLSAAYSLLWSVCRKAGGHPLVATACTFAAMVVCGGNWGVRPQSFSTFLFALFFWLLVRHARGEQVPWWLFPLGMVVWANLHGGFVLGLGLLGAAVVGEGIAWLLPGRPFPIVSGKRWTGMVGALVSSVVGTLVNPAGLGVYAYVRRIQRNPVIHGAIAEWQPPRVDEPVGAIFFGSLFLLFLVLLYRGYRPHPREALWLLGTGWLALGSVRSILWYTFPMALLLAQSVGTVRLPRIRKPRVGEAVANGAVLVLLLALVVAALPPFKGRLPLGADLRGTIAPDTPVRATDYILSHGLAGPIFHRMEYGDYLLWRCYPERRVFVDPRIELYPPAIWEAYEAISQGGPQAANLLEQYGIRVLLLDRVRQARLLEWARSSGLWHLCFEDEAEGTAVLAQSCPGDKVQ